MKLLFGKFLLLVGIVLSVYLIFAILPFSMEAERAAIVNKYEYAKSVKTRRLMLIGGSGLYVGINSDILSNELNYECCNLGLWAGFGLRFHLELVKEIAKDGDVVFLIPEYSAYDKERILDITNASREWLYAVSPKTYFKRYPFKMDYWIKDVSRIVQLRMRGAVLNCMTLQFNELFSGGMRGFQNKFTYRGDAIKNPFPCLESENMEGYTADLSNLMTGRSSAFLSEYVALLEEKGVTVLVSYPAYPQEAYDRNKEQINQLHTNLLNESIPVLSPPQKSVYSSEFFTNSVYHLTNEGKALRTKKVKEELISYLNKKDNLNN